MKSLACAAVTTSLLAASPALGARDPLSPQLHATAAGTRLAARLLLSKGDMRSAYRAVATGASATNNGGACGGVDPDLRALTDTGEAYGDALVGAGPGMTFEPVAYVFVSARQAARAQALDSAPSTVDCATEIGQGFMRGAHARSTSRASSFIRLRRRGTTITERRVVFATTTPGPLAHVVAGLYFFRRGRALTELVTFGQVTAAGRRDTQRAIDAMVAKLVRAGI